VRGRSNDSAQSFQSVGHRHARRLFRLFLILHGRVRKRRNPPAWSASCKIFQAKKEIFERDDGHHDFLPRTQSASSRRAAPHSSSRRRTCCDVMRPPASFTVGMRLAERDGLRMGRCNSRCNTLADPAAAAFEIPARKFQPFCSWRNLTLSSAGQKIKISCRTKMLAFDLSERAANSRHASNPRVRDREIPPARPQRIACREIFQHRLHRITQAG